jgi:hypothetical protein
MGLLDKRRQVKATIVRIWDQPPPGAPWYYWVYVTCRLRVTQVTWISKGIACTPGNGQTDNPSG